MIIRVKYRQQVDLVREDRISIPDDTRNPITFMKEGFVKVVTEKGSRIYQESDVIRIDAASDSDAAASAFVATATSKKK